MSVSSCRFWLSDRFSREQTFWQLHAPRLQLVHIALALALVLGGVWCAAGLGGSRYIVVRSHPSWQPSQLPGGGRMLFPADRIIALYGTPGEPVLGALGQQPLAASIMRAKALVAQYQPLMRERAVPALEVIATVASASPAASNSYSYPVSMDVLRAWVTTARQQGVYVVLDLQPGRESFPAQAQRYRTLLMEPNVGLALDPEWRLKPGEVPLVQIGSVDIAEVNQTAVWLAQLTRANKLPQKLFLLHEFRPSMLPDRAQLDTTHPELAYVIQMDGQGTQPQKLDTWKTIMADPPAGVHFGWKNFYVKDTPTRSPADTMALTPQPWYVSYQ